MTVQPADSTFCWMVDVFLDNNIKIGEDSETHLLWFLPSDQLQVGWNPHVKKLEEKYKEYPNIKFFYFEDKEDILNNYIGKINYIPLLRPYCLREHFNNNPHLSKEAIFYCDCDILFTKKFPFEKYLEDDTCYLSNTASYLNLAYLEGKIEQSDKKEFLRKESVVERLATQLGISRDIIVKNDEGTGGAQYLLKNIGGNFWNDVFEACLIIRPYLQRINRKYFASESAGYQSWCADMWAVLYMLWKREYKTECPKDFDFAWATSPISLIDEVYIMHNAGVTGKTMEMNGETAIMFFKGLYSGREMVNLIMPDGGVARLPDGKVIHLPAGSEALKRNCVTPFIDKQYLESVSSLYATRFYANALLNVTNPIVN